MMYQDRFPIRKRGGFLMTAETIREHLRASPFRPFQVVTAAGREYRVPHPDFAWLTPTQRDLVVGDEFDHVAVLSVLHITEIQLAQPEAAASN